VLKEKNETTRQVLRQMIPLSSFIDIGDIYIGIEQLCPFKEVFIGEMFGSFGEQTSPLKWTHEYFITLPLVHLSYMS
jgi:hypothetical protein